MKKEKGSARREGLSGKRRRSTAYVYAIIVDHCCPVDGGYYFIITLQDKGF
jgi:hypothetical protein